MDKTAFLFAGQGSQYTGMGRDVYDTYTYAKDVFNFARSIRPDMLEIMWAPTDDNSLDQTINAQVAVFTVNIAIAKILYELGVIPDVVAGFSLGELAALCFAKVFDLRTGFMLVDKRARAMQKCCERNGGSMIAVLKLDVGQIKTIVGKFEKAWCVNFNAPGQIVVACADDCVDALIAEVIKQGGRVVKLKVSGAFHSPYMNAAGLEFSMSLRDVEIKKCALPVYANLTAFPYGERVSDYKDILVKQVNNPVLWQKTIENMLSSGVKTFIEVGPGAVLSGLVKKIADARGAFDIRILNASDCKSIESVIGALK